MVALATGSEATRWVNRQTSFKYVSDAFWNGGLAREKLPLIWCIRILCHPSCTDCKGKLLDPPPPELRSDGGAFNTLCMCSGAAGG